MTRRDAMLAMGALTLAGRCGSPAVAARRPAAEQVGWQPGDACLRLGDTPGWVVGPVTLALDPLNVDDAFDLCAQVGVRLVRLDVTAGGPETLRDGEPDSRWVAAWRNALLEAENRGLGVVLALDSPARWDQLRGWRDNPFGSRRGGPAMAPTNLLDEGPTRQAWLARLDTLVRRWAEQRSIVAWEPFAQPDRLPGGSPERVASLVIAASAAVKTADFAGRPVLCSLSEDLDWPVVNDRPELDWTVVRPFAHLRDYDSDLARAILDLAPRRAGTYHKPVLLDGFGLTMDRPGPLDDEPQANEGLRQAAWAASVCGALNGYPWWWVDRAGRWSRIGAQSRAALDVAAQLDRPVAAFTAGVDRTGAAPVHVAGDGHTEAWALSAGDVVLVWARDRACVPPRWPQREMDGATLGLKLPVGEWSGELVSTTTGDTVGDADVQNNRGKVTVNLPAYRGTIALRLHRAAG